MHLFVISGATKEKKQDNGHTHITQVMGVCVWSLEDEVSLLSCEYSVMNVIDEVGCYCKKNADRVASIIQYDSFFDEWIGKNKKEGKTNKYKELLVLSEFEVLNGSLRKALIEADKLNMLEKARHIAACRDQRGESLNLHDDEEQVDKMIEDKTILMSMHAEVRLVEHKDNEKSSVIKGFKDCMVRAIEAFYEKNESAFDYSGGSGNSEKLLEYRNALIAEVKEEVDANIALLKSDIKKDSKISLMRSTRHQMISSVMQ